MAEQDKTDEALDKLARAAQKLSPEQGIVARRNARQAVLKALRDVRRQLDTEYPAIRPKSAKKRPKLTAGHKITRLVKRGYVRGVAGDPQLHAARRCGIAVVRCPRLSTGSLAARFFWYPSWLDDACAEPALPDEQIKRCHRSPKARKKLLAAKLLTAPGGS